MTGSAWLCAGGFVVNAARRGGGGERLVPYVEETGARVPAGAVVSVIAFTVLLSVVAHGLTADPLARRHGPRLVVPAGGPDDPPIPPVAEHRLIRRAS